jgi:serine/threonine protein kinase
MEYVDGSTLAQLIQKRGGLSPDDAAPLLLQVADALVAAHAAGVVHRDVKPSNILVDPSGRVKLSDFGIARVTADPSLTQTGLVIGSPTYLAPEVATGGKGGEAGDVWSLGATMFFVLSGRPPYEAGDHVLSALYQIVNEDPPRLSNAGWMAPLLEATMVKDPAQRWSMEEVRDFLARPDRTAPPPPITPVESDAGERTGGTRPLAAAAPLAAPAAESPTSVVGPPRSSRFKRPSPKALLAGLAVLLLLAVGAVALLVGRDDGARTASPSDNKPSPSAKATKAPATPTAAGMESFIRDYVSTVASDPDEAWTMLTPKFQRESGGIDSYRGFWDSATNGRVISISTDPDNLSVSYQARFDNFNNSSNPTLLDLAFEDGRYRINGERTEGFVPAG